MIAIYALYCFLLSSTFQTSDALSLPMKISQMTILKPPLAPSDELAKKLSAVSSKYREKNNGKVIFREEQLQKEDPQLVSQLKREAMVQFNLPKTFREAILTFMRHSSTKFVMTILPALVISRLTMSVPITILKDLPVAIAVYVLWYLQEWTVHYYMFHGGEKFRSVYPFQFHDLHHDLPYFYVTIDSMKTQIVWLTCAAILAATVVILGASKALTVTALTTYTMLGQFYEFSHFLSHTKVPLSGYFQTVRTHHMKHHSEIHKPRKYLSMFPLVDKIMGTGGGRKNLTSTLSIN